jgi:hypothetical protein
MKNLNFIFFIAGVLFVMSCGKKSTPAPAVITVNSITPTSGSANTIVTITGTNFSTTAGDNTVKFNGVQAVVESATSTTIKAVVPLGAGTGPVSVATATLPVKTGPIFTYNLTLITTYFAGDGVYWQNGVQILLPRTGNLAVSRAILISGTDIYFAGSDAAGYYHPVYWKNGVENNLPITSNKGEVITSFIVGSDIYFAGYDGNAPAYWKNGVENLLPYSGAYALVNTMTIQGTDIYFAGYDGDNAVFWKNGTRNTLPATAKKASVTAIAIAGNDIYFGGTETRVNTVSPIYRNIGVYWKNGIEYTLPSKSTYGAVSAMTLAGTDVYFAGTDGYASATVPVYWKNGAEVALPKINKWGQIYNMVISGSDIYFMGYEVESTFVGQVPVNIEKPVYWKNGKEYFLPIPIVDGGAYSMYLLYQ